MKCPKCGYLGFEQRRSLPQLRLRFFVDARRCPSRISRFAATPRPRSRSTICRWSTPRATGSRPRASDIGADLDRIFGAPEPAHRAAMARAAVAGASPMPREELPLFGPPIPDDEPLITKASPPRPPLAVRRATPEVPRLRAEPPLRTPSLDLPLDEPDRCRRRRSCMPAASRRRGRGRRSAGRGRRTPASARGSSRS